MLIDLTFGACQNVHIKKTVSVRGQSFFLKVERSQNSTLNECAPASKIDLQALELTTRSEASVSTVPIQPEATMERQTAKQNTTPNLYTEDVPTYHLLRDLTQPERDCIEEIRRALALREKKEQTQSPLPDANSGNQ